MQKRITLENHTLGVPSAYEHPDFQVPVFQTNGDCPCAPLKEETPPEPPCEQGRYHLKDVIHPHPKLPDFPPICVERLQDAAGELIPEPAPVKAIVVEPETKPLKGILKNKYQGQVPCPCEDKMEMPPHCISPEQDPHVKPSTEMRPVANEGKPPCYMPQPEDTMNFKVEQDGGTLGPWATGRVDWGPLAGLTGTRPVVDKYTVTRFSEGEWRQHNKDILDSSGSQLHKANL